MENILVVSNSIGTLSIISEMLNSHSFSKIVTIQNAKEAQKEITENEYDLVIIDTPLPDEFGDNFATFASEQSTAEIILLVNNNLLGQVSSAAEKSGVLVLSKPVAPEYFYQSLKVLTANRNRLMQLKDENQKLQKKIAEIKLVDRAKCILIQYLNMTEEQAHKYIEKQAMDMRQSRLVTAENILKTYEL